MQAEKRFPPEAKNFPEEVLAEARRRRDAEEDKKLLTTELHRVSCLIRKSSLTFMLSEIM